MWGLDFGLAASDESGIWRQYGESIIQVFDLKPNIVDVSSKHDIFWTWSDTTCYVWMTIECLVRYHLLRVTKILSKNNGEYIPTDPYDT